MRTPWATYVVNNTPNHNDIILIQQYYSILLYDSLLLTTANNVGSTTLFNFIFRPEHVDNFRDK